MSDMCAETELVIKVSRAKMPRAAFGVYNRVAVLRVVKGTVPKMISARALGVVEVVRVWDKVSVGKKGVRCAFTRAMAEAKALIEGEV